jgi:hypothetical protein
MKSYSRLEKTETPRSEPIDEVRKKFLSEAVAFGEPTARDVSVTTQIVATYTRKKGIEIQRVLFR